jgi:hypothetical protein
VEGIDAGALRRARIRALNAARQAAEGAPARATDASLCRLTAALACAREGARLYETVRPGDGRLRAVLALVAPRLEGMRLLPRRTLVGALAVACTCEAETDDTTARRAATVVVTVAMAALFLDEGQPVHHVAALADQASQ